jgi:hypothetical protein
MLSERNAQAVAEERKISLCDLRAPVACHPERMRGTSRSFERAVTRIKQGPPREVLRFAQDDSKKMPSALDTESGSDTSVPEETLDVPVLL